MSERVCLYCPLGIFTARRSKQILRPFHVRLSLQSSFIEVDANDCLALFQVKLHLRRPRPRSRMFGDAKTGGTPEALEHCWQVVPMGSLVKSERVKQTVCEKWEGKLARCWKNCACPNAMTSKPQRSTDVCAFSRHEGLRLHQSVIHISHLKRHNPNEVRASDSLHTPMEDFATEWSNDVRHLSLQ